MKNENDLMPFNNRFYRKWEREILEDKEADDLYTGGGGYRQNRGAVIWELNKREWFNRVALRLPQEMLFELAGSKIYFAHLVLNNVDVTAKLSIKQLNDIYRHFSSQFIDKQIKNEEFAAIEKVMLNNPHFAKAVLHDNEILKSMSKQNFLYMLDANKNNADFCKLFTDNIAKMPKELSLEELRKEKRFRNIVNESPYLPEVFGRSTVLQKINIVERARQRKDTSYEPPKLGH